MNIRFITFIVVVSTIGQIAAEIYIPSMPSIAKDLNTNTHLVQMSMVVFLFGMAIFGILFGYLSDYFGRRKILILSSTISLLGTILCVIAPSIYILILGRLIQGIGLSGVGSAGKAIIRDRMTGVELAKFSSNLAILTVITIDISPFIGGILQETMGWRPIFILLLIYNIWAMYLSYKFKDDNPIELNKSLNLNRIFHTAFDVFKNKMFLKYNMMSALTYAVLMSYLAVASFLFEEVIGISPAKFGSTVFLLTFVYMFGTFINGQLLRKYSMNKLINNGVILMWIAGVYSILIATILPLTYITMVIYIILIYIASSALFANSSALAFTAINKNVGIASALYSSIQVFIAAIFAAVISLFKAHSIMPLAGIMITICILMTINLKIKSS
ncbi:MAG: MFS transporter [Burkholderiales bacterium]|nr:MFS transporter [Burkholderiales bacterium]